MLEVENSVIAERKKELTAEFDSLTNKINACNEQRKEINKVQEDCLNRQRQIQGAVAELNNLMKLNACGPNEGASALGKKKETIKDDDPVKNKDGAKK